MLMKNFIKEFKEFALQGNVMDMAVGVVMGAAFKSIIDALVEDIINPLIGLAFQTDLSSVVVNLPFDITLSIGHFISTIINFILMALVVFMIVKTLNKFKHVEEEVEEEPSKSDELIVLEEIKELLKESNK